MRKKYKQAPSLVLALLGTLLTVQSPSAQAQDNPPHHKSSYKAGVAAYDEGNYTAYLKQMLLMQEALPLVGNSTDDDANRPFMLYHLARAYALNGQHDAAIKVLGVILDDNLEALLITQAQWDKAFDITRQQKAYKKLQKRMASQPIVSEKISGSIYILRGSGCDLLASIGANGVLLIDSGYPPAARSIQRTLSGLGGKEIKYIVNTHKHLDHVGGNAALAKNATIIAHKNTRKAMENPQEFIDQEIPAFQGTALPQLTLSGPITLFFNGENVHIIPLPGHTEGDVIVHFEGSNVVHMGDRYFPISGRPQFNYPGPDLKAYLSTMNNLLEGLPQDGTVISGHNPPVSTEHLRLSHEALQSAVNWVQDGIDEGLTLEDMQAEQLPSEWNTWSRGKSQGWLLYLHKQLSAPAN